MSQHLPSHPSILALGYSEAAMLLRQTDGADIAAVISIFGKHEFPVEAPAVSHRLDLRFDDVEAVDLTDPTSTYRAWTQAKWAEQIGRPVSPPTIEDARAIIEFARAISGIEGTVLCHCQAGVSRSPAAALICLATWTGEGDEQHCVEQLFRSRPFVAPHRDLIRFGDSLLGRDGRLIAALDAVRARK
jgi:predicted protein tyrosine phosphatase